jgi:hypothetical protein
MRGLDVGLLSISKGRRKPGVREKRERERELFSIFPFLISPGSPQITD